jgi:hypothetical protein
MEDALAGAGCLAIAVSIVIVVYPFIALGRIWMYSKRQVELLEEVRDLLRQGRSPV